MLLVRECLADESYELAFAATLKTALRALNSMEPQAVLADLTLPDGHGIEAFLRLRAERPDIPIIVLLGNDDLSTASEAVRLGADDYLLKRNLDGRLVRRCLSYCIERHRLVARLEALIQESAEGMVVVDLSGTVRYMNPAAEALFGLEAETMLGKPFPFALTTGASNEIKVGPDGGRAVELRVTELDWKKEPARLASLRDVTAIHKLERLVRGERPR